MAACYLNLTKADDVDVDDCPVGLLPLLIDATYTEWAGWCRCGEWFMPGPAFDPEDVANAWGDHVAPDPEPRILFASFDPSAT
ncbi:MAG: hypothetical protein AAGE88_18295 [Actinomycetota bacterium]